MTHVIAGISVAVRHAPMSDFKAAVRALRKNPGFSLVAGVSRAFPAGVTDRSPDRAAGRVEYIARTMPDVVLTRISTHDLAAR
jgi:hypothetical protein